MSRLSRCLALLLGVSLACGAGAASEALLNEARAFAEQGRHAAALSRVERYLSETPQDQRARFLKGVLLVETGRSEEAIEAFKSLVRDHPELPEPYNNLAVLYAARGEYAEARDALLSAINTHPSYAIAHENLGDIYAKLAGIAYDKALSLDSSNMAARGKLALVHELFSNEVAPASVVPPTQVATLPDSAADTRSSPVALPVPASQAASTTVMTTAAVTPATDPRAAVRDTVGAWARAWSAQDVDGYLVHYGSGFQPPGGVTRAAWEAERERRLRAPASIKVGIDNLQVEVYGVDRARAVFTQSYSSDTYADRVRKVLVLARENSAWRIVSEVSD